MSTPAMSPQNAGLQQQIAIARARTQSGANWFIIIAGLSVVNTLISMGGGGMRFIFGLGITTYIDAYGHGATGNGQGMALGASVLCAAFVAMFGFFGRKEMKWAFLVGMALYVLDGLLLIPARLYLDAAFHAWGVFRIFQGLQALNVLEQLKSQAAMNNTGAVSASWQR